MAAGRDMKVSVLVQLVDRLTAPLRGMMRGITGIGSGIANIGRQIGVVGGALAAISLASPIQQAAAWDSQLRDITITAGKVGGEVEKSIAEMSARYQKLAFDTGQSAANVAKGAQTLIASGMDPTLIDKLMPTIARVATATGATIEDTAKTAFSLSDSLKVPAEQMEAMLGKLVVAGKLGRFEFRNMATEFPSLTAQMAKLGITGAEAVEHLGSSLQIAMLGTASPSEAANNLKNFLTKINAPEAIKKFEKELKVDVTGVMTDAAAKGINPVEAVIQKMSDKLKVPAGEIDKIMKKAGAAGGSDKDKEKAIRRQVEQLLAGTKVGRLYADMQVLDFLIPALLNTEKMKDFKRQLKEAGVDVIAQDFASQMRGLKPQLEQLSVLTGTVTNRIGLAFASNLPTAKAALIELLRWVAVIDQKWPGLIDGVLSWTGALLVLGAGVAVLTPVFAGLAAVLGVVKAALLGLLSPIGLVAAILAGAATLIISRWGIFAPFFARLGESVAALAGPLRTLFQGLLNLDFDSVVATLSRLGPMLAEAFNRGWDILKITAHMALGELDRILGTDLAGSDTLRTLVAGIIGVSAAFVAALPVLAAVGAAVAVVGAVLAAVTSPISLAIAGITALAAAGIYLYQNWETVKAQLSGVWDSLGQSAAGAWDGAKAKGEEFAGWCGQLPSRIVASLGDLGAQLMQAGSAAIEGLLNGMKAKAEELISWVAGLPGRIIAAIGSVDLGNIIKWPSMPNWLGGGAAKPDASSGSKGSPAPVTDPMGNSLGGGFNPASSGGGGFNPAAAPAGGSIGGSNGFAKTAAANNNVQVGGKIVVEAAEGTRVVNAQSTNPAVPVTPNRGAMLGRA